MNDMSEFTPVFFDAASAAWHANKIRRGPALVYKCEATTKAGTLCKHPAAATKTIATKHLCKTHQRSQSTCSITPTAAGLV
jgi:hypothetical protein